MHSARSIAQIYTPIVYDDFFLTAVAASNLAVLIPVRSAINYDKLIKIYNPKFIL
jgi:hypothetical protein